MSEIDVNERAVMGGNNPREEMTAFDAIEIEILDLYEESKLWLTGEPVTTQDQADALNTLMDRIKKAAKAADDQRVIEKKPHDDAIDDIQGKYNPLISGFFSKNKTSGKATMAVDAVKKALAPYLLELDRKQQEEARIKREEADRLREQALAAMRASDPANLGEREAAEKIVDASKAADKDANKAEAARPQARGEGRAVGLRTVKKAVMVDRQLAAKWVWLDCNEELLIWIQEQADKAVRAGKLTIPGFNIVEERVI